MSAGGHALHIDLNRFKEKYVRKWGFPGGSMIKNLPASAGVGGLILGSGRFPGEGNGIWL